MSDNCIFCKIARGEIPSKKVHEDDEFVAFHDINPAAPVHLLLIPRRHVVSLQDIGPDDAGWLGRMVTLATRLAADNGCRPGPEGGFRLMANSDRKSTRLNSSHVKISYAVFCLKKKKHNNGERE